MHPQTPVQKPQSVRTAVGLLWASMGLGVLALVAEYANPETARPVTTLAVIFAFGLVGFLFLMISAGKNWARIAYLVVFAMGSLQLLATLSAELQHAPLLAALAVAQAGVQAHALYLLFTGPGSAWFRAAAQA